VLLPTITLLPADWLQQDTVTLAQALLGQTLWRTWPDTGRYVLCRIVETEAYTQDDPACHAYQKNRGRAANLYQAPGLAYVYLIYGMYYCLNLVTEPQGQAGAVLFRALEVLDYSPDWPPTRLNGPGKLCRGLGLNTLQHNGLTMVGDKASPLVLGLGQPVPQPVATTRIGISRAIDWPWRFYDPASTEVSRVAATGG
jgi:DNA-3-methyladenine glycosylase